MRLARWPLVAPRLSGVVGDLDMLDQRLDLRLATRSFGRRADDLDDALSPEGLQSTS